MIKPWKGQHSSDDWHPPRLLQPRTLHADSHFLTQARIKSTRKARPFELLFKWERPVQHQSFLLALFHPRVSSLHSPQSHHLASAAAACAGTGGGTAGGGSGRAFTGGGSFGGRQGRSSSGLGSLRRASCTRARRPWSLRRTDRSVSPLAFPSCSKCTTSWRI